MKGSVSIQVQLPISMPLREAFIDALTRRSVEDPSSKIVVSGIPLRT
jgi:hypothetical protein